MSDTLLRFATDMVGGGARAMGGPLLTYALFTKPDVLQIGSKDGGEAPATITMVVSNDTSRVIETASISFEFLEGINAKDLFADSAGITTSAPEGWSISKDGAIFTAKPDTPQAGKVGAGGLTLVLSNIKVNEQVGSTPLTITEVTASGGVATQTKFLSKFPLQFEVTDLQVTPTPPVNKGDNIALSWGGTDGASYQLQYEDADGNTVTVSHVKGDPNQPLPSSGSYEIDNLQRTTTFYLIVTLADDGDDHPPTLTRNAPVEVKVANPKITSFRGVITAISTTAVSVNLEWNANDAESCSLTGDANLLKTSTIADPYTIPIPCTQAANKTWTLTANRSDAKSDGCDLTLSCQPTLIGGLPYLDLVGPLSFYVMPDNSSMYVTDTQNLWVVDPHSLQIQQNISQGSTGYSIAVSNDRQTIYVLLGDLLTALDPSTWYTRQYALLGGAGSGHVAFALAPNNQRIYCTESANQTLWAIDPVSLLQTVAPIKLGFSPYSLAISLDNTRIYVTSYPDKVAAVIDAASAKVLRSQNLGIQIEQCAISPDNSRLYVAAESSVWVFDANTLEPVAGPFPTDPARAGVNVLCVSPDNQRLYVSKYLLRSDGLKMYSTFSFTGGR